MKRIYFLVSVFIILLLVAFYFLLTGRPGIFKEVDNEFAIMDTAGIRFIEIRSADQIIILERLEGKWVINRHFPASSRRIKGLLSLIQRLKINSVVPVSIRDEIMERLRHDGRRLMILTGKKNPYVAFIYHDSLHTNATYMMAENSDNAYRMEVPGFRNRDIARLFVDEINYWREQTIFHLRPDEILSVSLYEPKKPENSFHLINNGPGDYQLFTNPDSIEIPDPDKEAIEQYLGYFSSVSFEQFVSSGDDDFSNSLRDEEADKIIKVRDSRNIETELKTFVRYVYNRRGVPDPDPDRLYAVMNNTDTTLLKYVEIDPVLKETGYFLKDEKK